MVVPTAPLPCPVRGAVTRTLAYRRHLRCGPKHQNLSPAAWCRISVVVTESPSTFEADAVRRVHLRQAEPDSPSQSHAGGQATMFGQESPAPHQRHRQRQRTHEKSCAVGPLCRGWPSPSDRSPLRAPFCESSSSKPPGLKVGQDITYLVIASIAEMSWLARGSVGGSSASDGSSRLSGSLSQVRIRDGVFRVVAAGVAYAVLMWSSCDLPHRPGARLNC